MRLKYILPIVLLALALAACAPATQTADDADAVGVPSATAVDQKNPADLTADEQAYPYQTFPEPTVSDVYPAPIEFQTYNPYPEPGQEPQGTPFTLDKPIYEGATQVSGSGPAGVPIFIADVTFSGEPIAQGVIGSDGTFSFMVSELEKGHRLGIVLGDLAGSGYTEEELLQPGYFGETALTVPTIGFFLDTALVLEK